jgi:hypothetical protein
MNWNVEAALDLDQRSADAYIGERTKFPLVQLTLFGALIDDDAPAAHPEPHPPERTI